LEDIAGKALKKWGLGSLESVVSKRLYHVLELPKQLQVTILALLKLGSSSALDVSVVTGKARAVESSYLNQLVTLKLVCKEQCVTPLHRGNPTVVFSVVLEALDW
jgi:hypothetical protein